MHDNCGAPKSPFSEDHSSPKARILWLGWMKDGYTLDVELLK
jgi:hypothetical protein